MLPELVRLMNIKILVPLLLLICNFLYTIYNIYVNIISFMFIFLYCQLNKIMKRFFTFYHNYLRVY